MYFSYLYFARMIHTYFLSITIARSPARSLAHCVSHFLSNRSQDLTYAARDSRLPRGSPRFPPRGPEITASTVAFLTLARLKRVRALSSFHRRHYGAPGPVSHRARDHVRKLRDAANPPSEREHFYPPNKNKCAPTVTLGYAFQRLPRSLRLSAVTRNTCEVHFTQPRSVALAHRVIISGKKPRRRRRRRRKKRTRANGIYARSRVEKYPALIILKVIRGTYRYSGEI